MFICTLLFLYLDVNHHYGGLGLDNLGDPSVPAIDELLHAHGPVTRRVEDHEQVADLLTVKMIRLSWIIPLVKCCFLAFLRDYLCHS